MNITGKVAFGVSSKGVTPALRAISCSPICQCIASAARHGMDISSAISDHMSALHLSKDNLHQQRLMGRDQDLVLALLDIPLVQPRKLIFTIFVPLTPFFEVVLVVQATADGTSSWQMPANVFPFHSGPTEFDDLRVFF